MSDSDIEWGLAELAARAPTTQLLTAYDDGRHRLGLASEKMRTAFSYLFTAFSLNLCPKVVDAVGDRLHITGFSDPDATDGLNPDAAALWDHSLMAQQASRVHRDALVTGDAHLIIWPDDDGTPTIYPQVAGQIAARYSTSRPGEIVYAVKAWPDDHGHYRTTIYYPDRIERFVTRKKTDGLPERATDLVPITDDDPIVPNRWETVPVVHFAHNAPVGRPGVSRLRDVIPLQDALNKTVIDLMVGTESSALPQRWAAGIEDDPDEHGRPRPLDVTPGSVLATPEPGAKFGEFSAGDLRQMVDVKQSFAADIASVSSTPLHQLLSGHDGGWPSGEALKTSDASLVHRCRDVITAWGPVWAQAMNLALRMADASTGDVRAIFESPETRESPLDQAQAAIAKQAAGIPRAQTWREMGYSETQIAEMELQYEAEQARSAEAAALAFNRGAAA